jgi:membrane protein implicated in regulation of membrane protease activity
MNQSNTSNWQPILMLLLGIALVIGSLFLLVSLFAVVALLRGGSGEYDTPDASFWLLIGLTLAVIFLTIFVFRLAFRLFKKRKMELGN